MKQTRKDPIGGQTYGARECAYQYFIRRSPQLESSVWGRAIALLGEAASIVAARGPAASGGIATDPHSVAGTGLIR
jgi:hypothetical protein